MPAPTRPLARGAGRRTDLRPRRTVVSQHRWSSRPADDYPDPIRHLPPYECRSAGLLLEAADSLTGSRCELDAYLARPYRFGELRSVATVDEPRVVFDYAGAATDATASFSLNLGDALRLALHLLALVQRIDRCER